MADTAAPDLTAAHRHLSAACFNACWALLDKPDRTPEEDEEMLRLTIASHFHWTKRPDYRREHASIAHWQASRVHAVLGHASEALRYATLAAEAAADDEVPAFSRGMAQEALARAEAVAGHDDACEAHCAEAERIAATLTDDEEREILLADLATLPRAH